MNESHTPLYTNNASSEFLSDLNKPNFTQQQLSNFSTQALETIQQQQNFNINHPPIAIYRIATEGSQTLKGGVIKQTTSQIEFTLTDGSQVRAAHKGDFIEYADGTRTQIVTAAGESNSHIALVGSYLSNGDQIINTPQGSTLLIERQGVPFPADFLPTTER